MKNKIIGIIGGMGPYASAYFYELLLKKSTDQYGAKDNDNYPEIVIDSVPVPFFISDTNKVRVAEKLLISRVKRLNNFGCTRIAMVCNTGHILFPKLVLSSKNEFVSMIDLVVKMVQEKGIKKVGVLATPTTIKCNLYGRALSRVGIKFVYPIDEFQKLHELIIRDVVAGKDRCLHKNTLLNFSNSFIKENKLEGIILGCTELPLVFPKDKIRNVVDCLDVLSDNLLKGYYKS